MKRGIIALALALAAGAASAQSAEKVYTLSLTAAQLQYVAGILAKQPFQDVATLLAAMQAQVTQQDKPPEPPAPPAQPEKK